MSRRGVKNEEHLEPIFTSRGSEDWGKSPGKGLETSLRVFSKSQRQGWRDNKCLLLAADWWSSSSGHNSDLRDFHEYIQNQVWGERLFTRQSCRRFYLVEIRCTEASNIVCFDSTHPMYLETIVYTRMSLKSELCGPLSKSADCCPLFCISFVNLNKWKESCVPRTKRECYKGWIIGPASSDQLLLLIIYWSGIDN